MLYFDFVFFKSRILDRKLLNSFPAVGHSVIRGFKPQVNGYAASFVVYSRESNPIKEVSTQAGLE